MYSDPLTLVSVKLKLGRLVGYTDSTVKDNLIPTRGQWVEHPWLRSVVTVYVYVGTR